MHTGGSNSLSDSYSAGARFPNERAAAEPSLGPAVAAVLPPVALMLVCLVHQLLQ